MRTASRSAEAVTNPASETDSLETPNETDIGFFKDMALHHEQALAMCQRVLGRDNGDSVQSLAVDILQNQSYERGVMYTWLTVWGESTAPPETVMTWMGMEMPAAEMTGLATDEQMSLLGTTTGMAQGRHFLTLMRAHHVGGVHMAASASENAATSMVRATAAHAHLPRSATLATLKWLIWEDACVPLPVRRKLRRLLRAFPSRRCPRPHC